MKRDSAAIIVAGGQGKRFGGKIRKQYLSLAGRPLLWWSVKAFESASSVGAIVLVVPYDDVAQLRKQFSKRKSHKPVHVVEGGATRAESVRHGLAAVPPGFKWIAVHDAVRPLITPALVENVLKETRVHRAAIAACPSKDTVKLATRSQMIQRTLPRETVWLAQTPQAFERKLLERAHHQGRHVTATDDALLVERLGVSVKLVTSPPENLKVTVPVDLMIAHKVIASRSPRRPRKQSRMFRRRALPAPQTAGIAAPAYRQAGTRMGARNDVQKDFV